MYGYHNGIYDQTNDFLMNFYASQCTNYPFTATITSTNTTLPTSYNNPFHPHNHHFINHHIVDDNDINSNNDNWANFNSSPDNFADFDSHFANMAPIGVESTISADLQHPPQEDLSNQFSSETVEKIEDIQIETKAIDKEDEEQEPSIPQCFVATTQVIEISALPPTFTDTTIFEEKREFQLGPNPADSVQAKIISALEELEDEEFYSLRDDSNEINSLTDDTDRKLTSNNENTEVPDDDDDDFASADER